MATGRAYMEGLDAPLYCAAVTTYDGISGKPRTTLFGPYSTKGAAKGTKTREVKHANRYGVGGAHGRVFVIEEPNWKNLED